MWKFGEKLHLPRKRGSTGVTNERRENTHARIVGLASRAKKRRIDRGAFAREGDPRGGTPWWVEVKKEEGIVHTTHLSGRGLE